VTDPHAVEGFLDARQRTLRWSHLATPVGVAPVYFTLTTAAIVGPDHDPRAGPVLRASLIVPHRGLVSDEVAHTLEKVQLSETDLDLEDAEEFRPVTVQTMLGDTSPGRCSRRDFERRAAQSAVLVRDELERVCSRAFAEDLRDGANLVVNGTLPLFSDRHDDLPIFGISKRSQASYLSPQQERELLDMSVGERTHLFRSSRDHDTYSCYLKVRDLDPVASDPMAGLVRIEVYGSHVDEIDGICQAVLDHAAPVKVDTKAWGSKLYPVYLCERLAGQRLEEATARVRAVINAHGSR